MSSTDSHSPAPGGLHRLIRAAARDDMARNSLVELSTELLARLESGQAYQTNEQAVIGQQLSDALTAALDVHENRFAARRYADLLRPVLQQTPAATLRGTTVVDLGCGSLNPFGFSFLLLMLGARRAYAFDLEPVQDITAAVRAMATAASWLLIDPKRVLGTEAIAPQQVLEHLDGFHLPSLAAGDAAGINGDRLIYRNESIAELSVADGEADAVFSVALFEHVDDVDAALDSLRRITKPGGTGNHVIDFSDHRIYAGEVASPFEFLKIRSNATLVHGSNRLRCGQFCALFERHGFAVEHVYTSGPYSVELSQEEHAQFVEPFRSMPREELTAIGARIVVRRR